LGGCEHSLQACGVRDHRPDYEQAGAVVHAVAALYGVSLQKSMYGRTYFGNERTTFVIDPAGLVAKVLRKVKPGEHDEQVLQALGEATPPAP
jgi:thioredoxin-dependent peroxiredoxin